MKEFNQRMINNIIPIIVLIKLNIHVIRQNIIKIQFTIKEVGRETWKYFSKYHYLSELLPGGKIHLYGIFHKQNHHLL